MPMSSKKWLHGSQELCPCQARNGYIEVKNYAHDKQEVVTWRSRTMPMSSKKWLHGGLELCPCQARSGYIEVKNYAHDKQEVVT